MYIYSRKHFALFVNTKLIMKITPSSMLAIIAWI